MPVGGTVVRGSHNSPTVDYSNHGVKSDCFGWLLISYLYNRFNLNEFSCTKKS